LRFDFDLDRLVDEVATRVAAELADRIASEAPSPWKRPGEPSRPRAALLRGKVAQHALTDAKRPRGRMATGALAIW
jgi:hypothetical protein